jgi:hypothetical protein
VLIQIGARVMVRDGHWRSVKLIGLNERYFVAGFFNIFIVLEFDKLEVDRTTKTQSRAAGREPGLGQLLGNYAVLRVFQIQMEARSSRPSPVERASSSEEVVWARYIGRNGNILLGRRQAPRARRLLDQRAGLQPICKLQLPTV